jgi:hypothetical protein
VPASAYFRISAKDETKAGIRSALGSLNTLKGGATSALGGLKSLAGGIGAAFAAIGIAGAGISSIKDAVSAFQTAEASSIKLAQAIRTSPLISGEGFSKITAYTAELQRLTGVDEDLLNSQASLVVAMGLTADQTQEVLAAAVELNAAGVMPLETAIESLGKSYSGNITALGKQIPALKNLTKEQLANGEAVKIVSQNYAGMAAQMASTTGGVYKIFQASLGELQESIGKPFAEIGTSLIRMIKPAVDTITKFISENSYKIVNFFANIPEIARLALSIIPKILETMFSLEFARNYFKGLMNYYLVFLPNIGKAWFNMAVNGYTSIFNFIKGVSAGLWVPLGDAFTDMFLKIGIGAAPVFNFIIEQINKVIEGLNLILNSEAFKWATGKLGIKAAPVKLMQTIDVKKMEEENAARLAARRPVADRIEEERAKAYKAGIESLKNIFDSVGMVMDGLVATLGPGLSVLGEAIDPIIGQIRALIETEKKNTQAVSALTIASGGTGEAIAPGIDISGIAEGLGLKDFGSKFAEGFSLDIGKLSGEGLTAALAPLSAAIAPLLSSLLAFAGPIALLTIILTGLIQILLPAVNTVIKPVIDALTFLGQMLGALFLPVLDTLYPSLLIISQLFISLLEPIIEMLIPVFAGLAFLLETLVLPIIKGLAIGLEILWSPIKWVGDLFRWFGTVIQTIAHNINEYIDHLFDPKNRDIRSIPGFTSNAFTGLEARIAAIWATGVDNALAAGVFGEGWEDLQTWIETGQSGLGQPEGGAAASASYATRDVTINFYNQAPAVGDEGLKKLALILREQLAEAEALGA